MSGAGDYLLGQSFASSGTSMDRVGVGRHELSKQSWCRLPDGRDHGPFVQLWDNGTIAFRGEFENGEFAGTWVYADPDGTITAHEQFANGESHGMRICPGVDAVSAEP